MVEFATNQQRDTILVAQEMDLKIASDRKIYIHYKVGEKISDDFKFINKKIERGYTRVEKELFLLNLYHALLEKFGWKTEEDNRINQERIDDIVEEETEEDDDEELDDDGDE